MPTDNIIQVLDDDEEALVKQLNEINDKEDPDKDLLLQETDDDGT